jgi:proline dehydrogenase
VRQSLNAYASANAIPFVEETISPLATQTPATFRNPIPDFNDAKVAYEAKSNRELFVASLSFGLCRIPFLVQHAEGLLRATRKILGDTATNTLLKYTLFGHFCAGEDETSIQPAIQALAKAGIGSILDFAAEDDGQTKSPQNSKISTTIEAAAPIRSRMYDYENEATCDEHVKTFLQCIQAVASLPSDGFAAVKVTALGNPNLLERMSRAILEAQNLFAKFDANGDGLVSREEFERGYDLYFQKDDTKKKDMMDQVMRDDQVDYISWSMMLQPKDLPKLTAGCRQVGPLALAAPSEEEIELIETMYERGHALGREAAKCGTRLLVDAEQVRFQPAIDNLVLELQRSYNSTSDKPIIYNTYQCYLKDAYIRLQTDVKRSERFGYHFGAKLVRGAYMESERALAKALGYPSPIQDTIEDTHACYHDSVEFLLKHSKVSDKQVEVMLATHNQASVEKAIHLMNEIGIDRSDTTISFGQLFGMMDNLTYNLGKHGYRAYKYVPYGEVKMVMPYLLRRATENSAIAGSAGRELKMISRELYQRYAGAS